MTTEKTIQAPRTLDEFMVKAYEMEIEASQRYTEFADAMETHNNREVTELFRKMSNIEELHAAQVMAEMGWTAPPAPSNVSWEGFEGPETIPMDEVHYLMQPWHALTLALAGEECAERFYGQIAEEATIESVRKAALELQAEEREHVALIRKWMEKVPKPDQDWAHDPDPPRYTD